MFRLLFRNWWGILLQGILLIILSIFIFNNPVEVLAGISFWFGLIIAAAGIIGIIAWFAADKAEKEDMSLFWSILTAAFGLLMLFNLTATMKTLTIIFGLWVLVSGILLLKYGWSFKEDHSLGWVMVITGLLSVIVAAMIIFNIGTGAVAISILLGLQVLITGIALVLLSFAKKMVVGKIKNRMESLRS